MKVNRELNKVLKMRSKREAEVLKRILGYAIKHAGSNIVLVGRSCVKVKSTVERLLEMLNPRVAKVDWTRGRVDICNGSRIMFASIHSEEEAWRKCGGWRYDAVFCDENLLEADEAREILCTMKTRLVGTDFPLRFFVGAEEVRFDGGGGDTDPESEPEAAAVPAVEG